MSSQARAHSAKERLDFWLRGYAPKGRDRHAYWNLVRVIRDRSEILKHHPNPTYRRTRNNHHFVAGIAAAARSQERWIRAPESWEESPPGAYRSMRSLLAHLFESYPVPDFVAHAWFGHYPPSWHHELYLHMAAGHGIRQFKDRPAIPLSAKGARHFLEAPADLTPTQAMRWGQILALGATKEMARKLVFRTLLSECTSDEHFWETVLRFLIANAPLLSNEEVRIVDFLENQRFIPGQDVWGRGGGVEPLQPDFSMNGRTLRSLRRHMTHWRDDLLRKKPELAIKSTGWARTEFAPMVHRHAGNKWMIFELVSDRALLLEAAAMRHCVKDYIDDCATGRSSIWSLRLQAGRTSRRMATIEVKPGTRRILQAKGRCNSLPTLEAWHILERWAEREGLEMCWRARA